MKQILAYRLPEPDCTIELPKDATILRVGTQIHRSQIALTPNQAVATFQVMVYAMIEEEKEKTPMHFKLFKTGEKVPAGYNYVGTATVPNNEFHVFYENA